MTDRIERAAKIRIEQRGIREALAMTEGLIRSSFHAAAHCHSIGDQQGVEEHRDRADFEASIHARLLKLSA